MVCISLSIGELCSRRSASVSASFVCLGVPSLIFILDAPSFSSRLRALVHVLGVLVACIALSAA